MILTNREYPLIQEKQVWKGHEYLEELRVYGEGGELIFDMHELDEKGE